MFFYVVSRTYAEIFSLLRICSGLLSNSPGLCRPLLPSFRTLVVSNYRCCSLSLSCSLSLFRIFVILYFLCFARFAISYFCCFVLSFFLNLLFHTSLVVHFFLFNSYLVMHFQFPCCPVPMILGSMFPNIYVPDFLVPNTLPLPNTFYPPVFVRCFVFLLLLSCTFGLILIFHGLYNVSRSLCSPGGPTYVPSPSVSYFCCFVLSLICTFVVSYFLNFVVSQFRYFTLQSFHTTLWYRPFRTGPLFAILIFHSAMFPDLYVPQYLCSPIPMFPGPMFPDT